MCYPCQNSCSARNQRSEQIIAEIKAESDAIEDDEVSTTEVLIIDDDRTTRDSLGMLLEFEGYNVSSCGSGASAFDLVKEKCFEVILIDYRMPEMNGDEVTRILRLLCPDALVIGFSIETKDRMFLAAGADAFISKNALVHELVPLIKTKLSH